MSSNNEYMKKYMIRRYHERMNLARNILGNKCKVCATDKNLELDHINPNNKTFTIGGRFWSCSRLKFLNEVKKCQLLCSKCHNLKTLKENGLQEAKGKHGTLSTYRYCRCYLCKEAKRKYMEEYRKR